ncbi:MAG: hypothetical protein DI537_54110, partial [Stutzerimonas stutzeri]
MAHVWRYAGGLVPCPKFAPLLEFAALFSPRVCPRALFPCSRNCVACFPVICRSTWALPIPLF